MRRVLLFTLGFVWLASGCGQSAAQTPTNKDTAIEKEAGEKTRGEKNPSTVDDLLINEPIRHANLAIFPITSPLPKTADRFITLDTGLKAGTVEVMEVGAWRTPARSQRRPQTAVPTGPQAAAQTAPQANPPADDPFAQPAAPPNRAAHRPQAAARRSTFDLNSGGPDVNRLLVLNRAERPLYLMPGEIIVGGKQDRAVAQEYVIAPAETPVTIRVFCVEHGRWQQRDARETARLFSSANAPHSLADSVSVAGGNNGNVADVAAKGADGKFFGSVGNVSKAARMAVQGEKNQGQVWNRVAQTNRQSQASSSSGAFTANYASAATLERLEPYVESVRSSIANRPQIVGVLVAVNGRIESLDVFESTPLFEQLWPKLLKSYALDAANASQPGADKTCSIDDARAFLAKALAAQVASTETNQGLVTSTRDTKDFICFSAHDQSASQAGSARAAGTGAGMGMRGSFGGAVHTSGFAK